VGGRPTFLKNIKNSEKYCISSDDIFSLKTPPNKSLVVGGMIYSKNFTFN
jgi:pyruvate/2-oxoglutarate dehydrogenase complex dihydrolipoamide dehydrogenase (E3) component